MAEASVLATCQLHDSSVIRLRSVVASALRQPCRHGSRLHSALQSAQLTDRRQLCSKRSQASRKLQTATPFGASENGILLSLPQHTRSQQEGESIGHKDLSSLAVLSRAGASRMTRCMRSTWLTFIPTNSETRQLNVRPHSTSVRNQRSACLTKARYWLSSRKPLWTLFSRR